MGIFSKITAAFRPKQGDGDDARLAKELESLNKDGRLHARYVVHGEGIAYLKLDQGLSGVVKDVSYGGLAVKFGAPHETLPPDFHSNLPTSLAGTFVLLDQQVACRLSPVRVVAQPGKPLFVGFSVHHEGPETLLFLRDFIEPLRCGRTLMALDPSMRQERYQGPEWSLYRGEGPTDLLLRTKPNSDELDEALLTFRANESYCEVSYKNGQLKTGRSVDREGVATRMASNADAAPQILRSAVYILMSAPPASRKLTKPMLREAMKALRLDPAAATAA